MAAMLRLFHQMALGAACVFASAMVTLSPAHADEARRPITLESVFTGKTFGRGVFAVPIAGVERKLEAKLTGYRKGDEFHVAEDFVFDDGEKQHLTWRFKRTGPTTWSGKREDTVGEAKVIEADGVVRLEYTADTVSHGKVNRLEFSDLIYGLADGRFVNTAVVHKFGLDIGSIRIDFNRAKK